MVAVAVSCFDRNEVTPHLKLGHKLYAQAQSIACAASAEGAILSSEEECSELLFLFFCMLVLYSTN